jgi:HD-GYP domain-containing protein (c-di-GMP phosphodiesterase class II)
MNRQPHPVATPYETVRDRCRSLGMPTWRAGLNGSLVEEPGEPGTAGLWLRSGYVREMVQGALRAWMDQPLPGTVELFPSCWLIPVSEEDRGRRTGLLACLALGPDALRGEQFDLACRSAGLDPQAARISLGKSAVMDEAGAQRIEQWLSWSVQDVVALSENQRSVQGFTAELANSYETIDLLYALGRSMRHLDRPERFLSLVCDRLHEHLPFGWLAAKFVDSPERAGQLASKMFLRGRAPGSQDAIEAAMNRLVNRPMEGKPFLADGRGELGLPSDARVVVQPIVHGDALAGVIACGEKCGDDPQVSSYETQLLEAAGGYTGAMLENASLYHQQQRMFLGTLRSLTAAIDAKDRYTCGHSERVAWLAQQLSLAAGLDEATAERVHICGLVHDVGKIGVPEAVLCKPGRLTNEEFAIIKLHPEIGHRILKDIPMLEDVLPGVLHHHERWDGRGYPHQIRGGDIPIFARLLALADTFDAMSSTRSYRGAMPRPQVLAEIEKNAGTQFDPDLAPRFVKLDFAEYDRMVEGHAREQNAQTAVAA